MRDRLIEIFRKTNYQNRPDGLTANLATQFSEYALREIVDALLANGIIVPPCKVGDTVYYFVGSKICNGVVENFQIYTEQNLYIARVKTKFSLTNYESLAFWQFGKTVFLTKEQAEKALAEVANGTR